MSFLPLRIRWHSYQAAAICAGTCPQPRLSRAFLFGPPADAPLAGPSGERIVGTGCGLATAYLPISYMLVMFRLHLAQSLPFGPLAQCEPSAFREVLTWCAVRPGRLCWPQCLDTCDPRSYPRPSPLSCSCHFCASSRARRLAQAQSVFHLPSSIFHCLLFVFIVAKDGLHRAHQSLAQRPRVALVCRAILPP
jgi:hypothetical protein